jgi:glyoxylase-like metal-dependent hydrolase (beta-lactamase superfamily II)
LIHRHGDVIAIDSVMHGRQGITAVYYLDAQEPAIIETAPTSSLEHVLEGLEEAGVTRLSWIVLTHIHLDHAGAVGHISERFPDARVVVRAEGAPHLIDPSRLWASAARLYPDMEKRWGEMRPVPEDRIDVIDADGIVADLGDGRTLEAIYTPGHAKHHMALYDRSREDLFVGDVIGVYLPDAEAIRPATPPPEFEMEVNLESIERLRAVGAARVFPTHFGPVPDPNAAFDEGAERIRQWVKRAESALSAGGDKEEVIAEFERGAKEDYAHLSEDLLQKFEQTTSYALNAAGIIRYIRKRSETS